MEVRGRTMVIDTPSIEDRTFVFEALRSPAVHVPLGLKTAPERSAYDSDHLILVRGEEVRNEPVRYHIFRELDAPRPIGFVVDFGWDHPGDSVREIDLAFPDPKDRNLLRYFDSSILIAQFLFKNRLAKRFRWRVVSSRGQEARRSARQGGRLISKQEEKHPVSGEWMLTHIYEFSRVDFEELGRKHGFDPYLDYADQDLSMWRVLAGR